jgi:hypothetical protein
MCNCLEQHCDTLGLMQVGSGDIVPRLINLATWLKYEVTSHQARSTEGTPTPIEDDASWLQEQIWTLCSTCEYILSAGNWNTICRSASPHSTPAAELINFQLYQPSRLYKPDLVADYMGFVLDKVISREVCFRGPKFFYQSHSTECRCAYSLFHFLHHKIHVWFWQFTRSLEHLACTHTLTHTHTITHTYSHTLTSHTDTHRQTHTHTDTHTLTHTQ